MSATSKVASHATALLLLISQINFKDHLIAVSKWLRLQTHHRQAHGTEAAKHAKVSAPWPGAKAESLFMND